MFLFVFYYQGAQSNSPIEAGIKLIPLALGMLIASPLAGIYADRHGSRTLAALGMLVSAVGLAGMTTLGVHTAYWQSAVWLALVGVGSGMFNSPNTAAMMGAVPAQRRGIAAGARTLVQNTGAVLSIAFVLAIVTSSVPKSTLFAVFSGLAHGLSAAEARAVHRQHARRPVGARGDLAGGRVVCLLRPSHVDLESRRRPSGAARGPTNDSGGHRAERSTTCSERRDARRQTGRPACGSATSPSSSARPRGRSATTRRSACCRRRPRARPAGIACTPTPRSSACAR